MIRCLLLLTLFLASCASTKQLQVRSVKLPSSVAVSHRDASELVRVARQAGGTVRTWTMPIHDEGTFAFTDQKRSFFVSAYDSPTATHAKAEPTAYDSKMVGVSIAGHVEKLSNPHQNVSLIYNETKKTGVNKLGQGVEQPVFWGCSIDFSWVLDGSDWAVIPQPSSENDSESHFLLLRAR